jgi:hypothetical protein
MNFEREGTTFGILRNRHQIFNASPAGVVLQFESPVEIRPYDLAGRVEFRANP